MSDRAGAQAEEKLCFVICPFGQPESEQRKRSNMLLEFIVTPAVTRHGYTVIRADLSAEPGVVTTHIIRHLIEDALVVADITDRNPNVFYELAIRHSIRKPFVQVIQEGDKIPFNISGIQTIEYDLLDVAKIKNATNSIENQVVYYETTGKVSSPVSVAIDEMISTAGVEQFQVIMERLEALDSGVESAEQMRLKIVEEVRTVVDELRAHFDAEAIKMMSLINRGVAVRDTGDASGRFKDFPDLPIYDRRRDDPHSTLEQKEERRGRGEFTIGEWLDIQHGRRR